MTCRESPLFLSQVDAPAGTDQGSPSAGPGTFGDLAVMTPDGPYVYATFDSGMTGTGGVAVVHVPTRTVVATWPYPGAGRPHGIGYSSRTPRF